jgi:hypothetical protein
MLRLTSQCPLAALMALAWVGAARAEPIITGTATPQPDGSYLYQYTLTSPSSIGSLSLLSPPALDTFYLQGVAGQAVTGISQPSGWTLTGSGPDTLQWGSSPHSQTATFSFSSQRPPGSVIFDVYGPYTYQSYSGPRKDYWDVTGTIVGPEVGAPSVLQAPEPSTLALAGLGALGLMGCAWRRRAARLSTP